MECWRAARRHSRSPRTGRHFGERRFELELAREFEIRVKLSRVLDQSVQWDCPVRESGQSFWSDCLVSIQENVFCPTHLLLGESIVPGPEDGLARSLLLLVEGGQILEIDLRVETVEQTEVVRIIHILVRMTATTRMIVTVIGHRWSTWCLVYLILDLFAARTSFCSTNRSSKWASRNFIEHFEWSCSLNVNKPPAVGNGHKVPDDSCKVLAMKSLQRKVCNEKFVCFEVRLKTLESRVFEDFRKNSVTATYDVWRNSSMDLTSPMNS